MATYEDLRFYFEESGDLRQIVHRAAQFPIVTGFTLDIDPLWALIYDSEQGLAGWPTGSNNVLGYGDQFYGPVPDSPRFMPWWERQAVEWYHSQYQGFRKRNLYKSLSRWDDIKNLNLPSTYKRLPVVLTIVHRPARPPQTTDETEDSEVLRGLIDFVRNVPVVVRVEERVPARLAAASALSVDTGTGAAGTLGGALYDTASGKAYGISCDHVASAGEMVYAGSKNAVGKCRHSTPRVALAAPNVCDPVTLPPPVPTPGNGPSVNMLDCALIELSAAPAGLHVGRVLPSLTPGQNVIVNGAVTGKTHHKLGSLCLSYSFTHAGKSFCFRDAIELLPRSTGPFGGALGRMMGTVPTQGDSGAWVISDDSPADWAALFFGEDGYRGFAIRASWTHQWAETALGTQLRV